MTTPTVRGRVWRQLVDVTTVGHDPDNPILIPAGWGWRVRQRTPDGAWPTIDGPWTTLIEGVAATQQAALGRACRHIRLAHDLDNR